MLKCFDKIIGYDSIKIELERILDSMNNPENYEKLGVRTPRGLLLEGEPGVGKTTMAKAFIKESGRKAFTLRKNLSGDKFTKSINKVFKDATEAQPSIVFLDDLDKFSNEDMYHTNSDEFITIQSCIDDCAEEDVFVIATANDLDCVPRSLLREGRFDKRITVENPSEEDVEKIIKYYLSNKKVEKNLNYKDIARFLGDRSCASLETVLNEAGIYAAFDKREKITMDDIVKAFIRVVYMAPENITEKEYKYIKNTAVHEAGHTVLSELLKPGSVTVTTVKKHASDTKGFAIVDVTDEDGCFEEMKSLENDIIISLGGKAATEIVYGTNDTSCSADLHDAYNKLDTMFEDLAVYGFQGVGATTHYDSLHDAPSKLYFIQVELAKYYMEAKKLLIENREFLDKVTNALVEKQTITFRDLDKIKKELGYAH